MSKQPEWLATIQREAEVRSGLVLYGNTRDIFWAGTGADYVTLPALLTKQLKQFTIRASWDQVDGLRFASDDDRDRWDRARQSIAAKPGSGTAYDMGDDAQEGPTTTGIQIQLQELIAQYRVVLSKGTERPLLIIDWSHLLVTQPAHPDQTERTWIQQLGKALVGERDQRIDSDRLRGSGLVIVVSANLGAVPPTIYQGEPRIRLVSVPAPSRDARRAFFDRHADDLHVDVPRGAPGSVKGHASSPRQSKVESLADSSDQLTTADLRQIVALSRSVKPALRTDRLLNLYRFGDQRSPWEELSEERLSEVDSSLKARVIGQDAAVTHVATMILRAWLGLAGLQHSARRSKPKGTLFFVGPTGVGKTELAKACAAFLFGE
jgi:hypothetical protein